jgi:hypothetical protein
MSDSIDAVSGHSDPGLVEANSGEQARRKRSRRYHKCPECDRRTLVVIHRRSIDRMTSWFFPVRRYRCRNPECRWEGNLPSSEGKRRTLSFWQMLLWGTVSALLLFGFWRSLSVLMRGGE